MEQIINHTLNDLISGNEAQALTYFYRKALPLLGHDTDIVHHIRALIKDYASLDHKHKRALVKLSALLYNMLRKGEGEHAAQRCAKLLRFNDAKSGYSISEQLYLNSKATPAEIADMDKDPTPVVDKNPMLIFQRGAYVVQLGSEPEIFCYKDRDGSLVLLFFIPANDAVLCDEDMFNDEAPLYFTASSHFVSPLYHLDITTSLLHAIMSLVGYPYLRIRHKVVYLNGAYPINAEDMWEEAWKECDMEVIVQPTLQDVATIEAMPIDTFTPTLRQILAAASHHLDNIHHQDKVLPEHMHAYVKNNIHIL